MTITTDPRLEADATALRQLIRDWDDALYQKDIDRLATFYTEDCTIFDVSSQVVGRDAVKPLWEFCLPYFGPHIGVERKDEALCVSGDLALFHSYNRLSGVLDGADLDAARSWLRTTVVFRRIDDTWKIHHEHISYPFDCEKEKPAYILDEA